MKRALLTLLLWPMLASAQSVKLPAEVKVQPGRLAAVKVEWDGDDLRWDVPPDLDAFREYDPDPKVVRLRLIGYAPGKYRLLAVAAKGGKLSDFATCAVLVGDAPVPPVPPGPPIPPAPNDPIFAALKAAFDADAAGDKRAKAAALASIYRAAAEEIQTATANWGGFMAAVKQVGQARLGNSLLTTRRVLGDELNSKLPTDPAVTVDASLKDRARLQFFRFAALLDALQ